MALCHWYIIPISTEIGMDSAILQNFFRFVGAVEFAMTVQPQTDTELQDLHNIIATFLTDYEQLYIGNDLEKILCA